MAPTDPPIACVKCAKPLTESTPTGMCETCISQLPAYDPLPTQAPVPTESFEHPQVPRGEVSTDPTREERTTPNVRLPVVPPGFDSLGLLGFGGMGAVYKVIEQSSERVLAVKIARDGSSPGVRDRFRIEARAMARLKHPNVVQVYAVEPDAEPPYFTMDCVIGESLDRRLKRSGALPPGEAAAIIAAVARGIEHAHAAGIIHRDLKPSNIILGHDGVPRVTDFGLAKRLDRQDDLTVSSAILGTPVYMAPEQADRRFGPIGRATDVYGLGATLYSLMTGHPPFPMGGTAIETATRVISEPPTLPRQVRPDLPQGLEDIVMKCLAKQRSARYASAADLADDLGRFLAGKKPLAPAPPGRLARITKGLQKRPMAVVGGVILVAILTGVLIWRAQGPGPDSVTLSIAKDRRDLANGKPVTLLGPTGVPLYQRTIGDACQIGTHKDGTLLVQTFGLSLVEFFPDPGIDRYQVRADLRLSDGNFANPPPGPVPEGQSFTIQFGLYVGYSRQTSEDGHVTHGMSLINHIDRSMPNPNGPPRGAAGRFEHALVFEVPHRNTDISAAGGGKTAFFPPSGRLPGLWRRFFFRVTPLGVTASIQPDPDGDPATAAIRIGDFSGPEIHKQLATLNNSFPTSAVPPWTPRSPIGIMVRMNAIGIRNVVIEPLTE